MKEDRKGADALLNSLLILIVLSGLPKIASLSLEQTADFNTSVCGKDCRDGNNCASPSCSSCEFYCGGICNYVNKQTCVPSCDQTRCSTESCKGCIFCAKSGATCQLSTFEDVTSVFFPKQDPYWYEWKHSGKPYCHEGAPLFVDLNNDGRLDYFNAMHAHKYSTNSFSGRMELGESVLNNFTKDDVIENESNLQRLRSVSERIIIDDNPNKLTSMDPHGMNIVDLDGDGILDILISTGGGEGTIKRDTTTTGAKQVSNDNWMNNFLLWGEKGIDKLTGESVTYFRGGRGAARKARVHMFKGRGRINYLLDVNGDGLLDIFCVHDRRVDNTLAPGILLINQGDRTWKKDETMKEFTGSMMLTDADGDGFAQEIMISRSFCFPQRTNIASNPNYIPFTKKAKKFCSTRPVGSLVVYKFNPDKKKMKKISLKYSNIGAANNHQPACCPHATNSGSQNCHAISMASADFDGDLLADHVILFLSKMVFYFSGDRAEGELPGGNSRIGAEIELPAHCPKGRTVRIVDLDNDGVEEIVVMCQAHSTFLVYTRGSSERHWVLDNGCNDYGTMGALNTRALAGPTKQDLTELCNSDDHDWWEGLEKICKKYANGVTPEFKTSGMCLVDFNNDGFLDAVVAHHFGYLRFFKNVPSEKVRLNRFITFSVKGDGKSVNEYGIGATVILYTKKKNRNINQFREISSYQHTSDKYGCKDDRIIFGLGKKAVPIKVKVRWPNGIQQEWSLNGWEFLEEVVPIQLALVDLS